MLERLAPYIEERLRNNSSSSPPSTSFLSSGFVQHYLKKYKLLKLRNTVRYAFENTRFYHDLFKEHNLKPFDIKTFQDLSKIPFTSSTEIKNTQDFFAVPETSFSKVFSSSGTTGKPKRIYFTPADLTRQISGIKTGLRLLYNVTPNDVCRITYDHGYGLDDWGVRYCMGHAVDAIGAMSLFTQLRLSAAEEKKILEMYKATVLMGTPSYLNSLTHDLLSDDCSSFHVRTILVGTEPLPSSVRSFLENTWKATVFQGYGMTEMGTSVAGECSAQNGMHVTESDFYPEVIDPKTGELLSKGEEGELVFTTLSRQGMPILRYRTHDMGFIMDEPCPCGLPFSKIKITGRTDKMLTIGSGDNVYPSAFEDALFGLSFVIDYQIILTRENNKDHIEVIVEAEKQQSSYAKEIENAVLTLPEINDGISQSKTILPIKVTLVKPHSLNKKRVKVQRLVDKRNLFS